MLNSAKPARRFAILAPLSAGLLLTSAAASAIADETPGGGAEQCAPNVICGDVHGGGGTSTGGASGGGGGGNSGGPLLCSWNNHEWPCHDPEMGWFNNGDGCYYRTVDKPADDPAWKGHKPSEGSLYLPSCPQAGGGWAPAEIEFHADNPAPPPPDPKAMALEIKDHMAFPALGPSAAPLGTAVVKSPVWLWVTGHQPPQPMSLTLRGVTVTVTPRLTDVVWNFSARYSLTCDKPGTPYDPGYGGAKSPDCGFEFPTGSAGEPGGAFTVNATANWVGEVTVTGLNTKKFEIPMPQTATFELKVAEVQVLN